MKVADVKFTWRRSVSVDIVTQVAIVVVDGVETLRADLSPQVEEITTEVKASSSVQFLLVSVDSDGNETPSETYTFTLGDLSAPQPATELAHTIVGIRDVADEPIDETVPEPTV